MIQRKKPLPRNTKPIARKAPLRNKKEFRRKEPLTGSQKAWTRSAKIKAKKRTAADSRRIYGSKERVRWVRRQPCVCCETVTGRNHNHHVVTGGTGFKADFDKIASVCPTCHVLHHTGELGRSKEWWLEQARLTEERWQQYEESPFKEASWELGCDD